MSLDVLSAGSPQLIDNVVFKKRVMSRDHYKYIYMYVVMSWDVLSVGDSTAG